jgi:AcrR family transcriptional regulator
MNPSPRHVKRSRSYDSTRRREQARQTRERIVRTAEKQFLEGGYAATSVAAIAAEAEVSVDSIYKTFGGKPGLIRAIFERALEGQGPVPAEQRSDRLQAEETDPRRIIDGWGRFVTELSPRGAPIVLLIRDAAATDPELVALLEEIDASRMRRMTANARRFQRAGHLRPGMSVRAAADVMWTYSSPELYDLLVLRRGMSLPRFGRFVADAMAAALLPEAGGSE